MSSATAETEHGFLMLFFPCPCSLQDNAPLSKMGRLSAAPVWTLVLSARSTCATPISGETGEDACLLVSL